MTIKNQISKIYQEKIKKFNKFNKSYFEKDNPLISDYEFDKLKKELINLEKTYPFLKSPKGVESLVGFKPSGKFEKIKHSKQMLSLGNAFDKEGMIDFKKKLKNFLNISSEIKLSSEPKIDGISASLRYEGGKLVYGLSRGDGVFGELFAVISNFIDITKKKKSEIAILKKEISINNKTIIFHLDNELESSIFDDIKNKLQSFLKKKFKEEISIEKKVTIKEKEKTIYTNKDKFEYLTDKNKNLIELKNRLGLDYEF